MRRELVVAIVFALLIPIQVLVRDEQVLLDPSGATQDSRPGGCQWLAGDTALHSAYSLDEADRVRSALSLPEIADTASNRQLDFVSVTDQYDLNSRVDPAYGTRGLQWVPGYEILAPGPVRLVGVDHILTDPGASPRKMARLARRVKGMRAIFEVGQPVDPWRKAFGTSIRPSSVQVWADGPWTYRQPFPVKDGAAALQLLDDYLDLGARVAAVGGSSLRDRTLAELAGPGQPTTWVCVPEPTPVGVLRGIEKGRTLVTHEYPAQVSALGSGGIGDVSTHDSPDTKVPIVFIEADSDGDGEYEALTGDVVPPESDVRVVVLGAPFARLRLVTDGSSILQDIEIPSPAHVLDVDLPDGTTWVRAEVFAFKGERPMGCPTTGRARYCDELEMLTLSSALYFTDRRP